MNFFELIEISINWQPIVWTIGSLAVGLGLMVLASCFFGCGIVNLKMSLISKLPLNEVEMEYHFDKEGDPTGSYTGKDKQEIVEKAARDFRKRANWQLSLGFILFVVVCVGGFVFYQSNSAMQFASETSALAYIFAVIGCVVAVAFFVIAAAQCSNDTTNIVIEIENGQHVLIENGYKEHPEIRKIVKPLLVSMSLVIAIMFSLSPAANSIMASSFFASVNTAKSLQEQTTRVAQAQMVYYQQNREFTHDIEKLAELDPKINTTTMNFEDKPSFANRLSVTGAGKESFFTVVAYWPYPDTGNELKKENGFAIQGNTNGVIATCNSRFNIDCENSLWEIDSAKLADDRDAELFPPSSDGSTREGLRLQQIEVPERSICGLNNPYGSAQLPFVDCSASE
jgi:hypothetical protein